MAQYQYSTQGGVISKKNVNISAGGVLKFFASHGKFMRVSRCSRLLKSVTMASALRDTGHWVFGFGVLHNDQLKVVFGADSYLFVAVGQVLVNLADLLPRDEGWSDVIVLLQCVCNGIVSFDCSPNPISLLLLLAWFCAIPARWVV